MVILKSSDEVLLSLKLGKSGGLKKLYKLVYDNVWHCDEQIVSFLFRLRNLPCVSLALSSSRLSFRIALSSVAQLLNLVINFFAEESKLLQRREFGNIRRGCSRTHSDRCREDTASRKRDWSAPIVRS